MANTEQSRWVNYGIVAAILLLLALLLYVVSEQFERVKTTINMGYTLEAMQNRYLAAQKYLERQSIPSDTAVDIATAWEQLQANDALLILNTRLIPEPYHDRLLDWVASGGHLVVTAQNYWSEDSQESGDPFLDRLGIEMYDVITEEAEAIGESTQAAIQQLMEDAESDINEALSETSGEDKTTEAAQCDVYGYSRLTLMDYRDQKPPIQVQFASYSHLHDASGDAVTPDTYYPNQILQYPVGQGMVTALTSHQMWSNTNIGWYDHAYFLWLLVQNAGKVWFVFDRESDSLLSLMMEHLLEPLVAALLLLALYLWHRAKRFGPVKPEPELARRSLMEHLLASARFNWRHQQIHSLVRRQRDDIKQLFILRHGSHHREEEVITTLAKSSQLSPEQVRWALLAETPDKEQEFTHLIRLLQRLRNAV
ncbi:MAG: DUF4350 domain-containing protein [Ketobacteraceae bacterium]|nr:DUF4350 domain-containing protein [Ketobacteraceae bacterium]